MYLTLKKFAVAKMNGSSLQTLYGLMQCSPEISERDCVDCLTWNIGRIPILCNERMGCREATVSCYLRYDTFRFYELTAEEPTRALPPAHLPSPPLPLNENERASDGNVFAVDEVKGVIFIVVLIVGCIIFVIASCVVLVFIMRRKKNNRYRELHRLPKKEKEKKGELYTHTCIYIYIAVKCTNL